MHPTAHAARITNMDAAPSAPTMPAVLQPNLLLLAKHSRWAVKRLLAGCAQLSPEDLSRDIGLPFRSVRATLNHMALADTVWMHRLGPSPVPAPTFDLYKIGPLWVPDTDAGQWDAPPGLEAEGSAEAALLAFADSWVALVEAMSEEAARGEVEYVHRDWTKRTKRRGEALNHVFNHHTHHRGQVSAGLYILSGLTGKKEARVPSMDLHFFIEETEAGKADPG
ncbi:DinB family-domain-containing protein [Hyaloraphidium curvatum]|nr:DinB family-domain-containing protein [Hyaloraphidium curvatum]